MTLGTLLKWYRHFSNEVTLPVTSADYMDATTLLQMGYQMYARKTMCFPVGYTLAATPGTAIYSYGDFGEEVVPATNPVTYDGAGSRLFKLSLVAFDSKPLVCKSRPQMDTESANTWRWNSTGTPHNWIPWGERQIRLTPAPNVASNIFIEGWETPDLADFAEAADEPLIEETDCLLIAMYAAAVPQLRDAQSELELASTIFGPRIIEGWKNARKRIHGSENTDIIFGRYSSVQPRVGRMSDSITNIT